MARRRMLIVDDNQGLVEALRTAFEDEYELEVAHSGEEALENTQGLQPQVVLIDYQMSGLNGVETMQRLHQQAPRSRMIVMSAHDDRDTVASALHGGAVQFVGKPFELSQLKQAVQHAVAGPCLVERAAVKANLSRPHPYITQREVDDLIDRTLRYACV